LDSEDAAYFSILFDVGGIIGGIIAGLATDYTGKSASTCAIMLIGAIPAVMLDLNHILYTMCAPRIVVFKDHNMCNYKKICFHIFPLLV
jgi:hypothetical protein